jgi:hypothetical protein
VQGGLLEWEKGEGIRGTSGEIEGELSGGLIFFVSRCSGTSRAAAIGAPLDETPVRADLSTPPHDDS